MANFLVGVLALLSLALILNSRSPAEPEKVRQAMAYAQTIPGSEKLVKDFVKEHPEPSQSDLRTFGENLKKLENRNILESAAKAVPESSTSPETPQGNSSPDEAADLKAKAEADRKAKELADANIAPKASKKKESSPEKAPPAPAS